MFFMFKSMADIIKPNSFVYKSCNYFLKERNQKVSFQHLVPKREGSNCLVVSFVTLLIL